MQLKSLVMDNTEILRVFNFAILGHSRISQKLDERIISVLQ